MTEQSKEHIIQLPLLQGGGDEIQAASPIIISTPITTQELKSPIETALESVGTEISRLQDNGQPINTRLLEKRDELLSQLSISRM